MQSPTMPGTGDRVDLKELNGSLLYISVKELVKDVVTEYGPTDAIRCDVAVLDGTKKAESYTDTLIFPSVLVGQLKSAVGSVDPNIVGRLGQGLAKPGRSAPWILNEPTQDDLAVAVKYEKYAAEKAQAQEEPF